MKVTTKLRANGGRAFPDQGKRALQADGAPVQRLGAEHKLVLEHCSRVFVLMEQG